MHKKFKNYESNEKSDWEDIPIQSIQLAMRVCLCIIQYHTENFSLFIEEYNWIDLCISKASIYTSKFN